MNKKGFINIIVIIGVIILAGVVGYFALVRKTPEVVQQTNAPTSVPITTRTPTPTSTPTLKNGIKGDVVGHYCSGILPAEPPPPGYQSCGEEPLASFSLKIKSDISGAEKQVITDSAGKFQIELLPGEYTITGRVSQAIIGGPFSVEVKSGEFIETQLKFEELRP